jgi:hypothetical protein
MGIPKTAATLLCTLALIVTHVCPARAADTIETWGVGATDVDFYSGLDGVGLGRADGSIFGDIMLGYGLVEGLSAYVGQKVTGNTFFTGGQGATYLGLFGTPVDTQHFDLDLFLGFDLGGVGYSEFGVTPMVELNFDLDPNRLSWGAYVRAGFRLHGHNLSEDEENPKWETHTTLATVIGTYYTIARNHQLLLEFDFAWKRLRAQEEREIEIGGLALGYNVTLSDRIELINQVHLNIPQPGEIVSVGFMMGLIFTLPSVVR